ncbi:hypothetical protein FRC08_011624 [Ceratobasidium sp. 394]|nr:hypothetical protein FRC08_011624 [Ceratobasidium sp. 394]
MNVFMAVYAIALIVAFTRATDMTLEHHARQLLATACGKLRSSGSRRVVGQSDPDDTRSVGPMCSCGKCVGLGRIEAIGLDAEERTLNLIRGLSHEGHHRDGTGRCVCVLAAGHFCATPPLARNLAGLRGQHGWYSRRGEGRKKRPKSTISYAKRIATARVKREPKPSRSSIDREKWGPVMSYRSLKPGYPRLEQGGGAWRVMRRDRAERIPH